MSGPRKPRTKHADLLWDYANRRARRSEAKSDGTQYPTVRECARHFRWTQAMVEEAAGEDTDLGYLGIAYYYVEFYVPPGDWFVEAY